MQQKILFGLENNDRTIQPLLVKEQSNYKTFKVTPERFSMVSIPYR